MQAKFILSQPLAVDNPHGAINTLLPKFAILCAALTQANRNEYQTITLPLPGSMALLFVAPSAALGEWLEFKWGGCTCALFTRMPPLLFKFKATNNLT